MEFDRASVAEDLLQSIVVTLLRRRILSRHDLLGIAAGFEREAHSSADTDARAYCRELALMARCMVIEAEGRTGSEEIAERRRGALRVIDGGAC